MTQEEKELLLKDLCARLLYGFIVHRYSDNTSIRINNISEFGHFLEYSEGEDFKPYLRPMSSMTEEERKEYEKFSHFSIGLAPILMDWIYSHHLDCCGLIEKGLAFEALEGMYD